MIGRIVEVSGERRYLSVDRGFMVVSDRDEVIGRIALDDVAALVCTARSTTYSNNLLLALSGRGCPVVLCGTNFMPAAIVWPTDSHHRQSGRLDGQIAMSKPARGRLWKQIVRDKVRMQALALVKCGRPSAPLKAMVRKVRSADRGNVEGQAARAYWKLLFGGDFRRDPEGDGINGLLNYGYAILRSTVARHLMASGLHPGIGLHHSNDGNAMRLVDDVMEPFRPVVDCMVWRLNSEGFEGVDADSKRELALLPTRSLVTPEGVSPVSVVVQRLCASLAKCCEGGGTTLDLPASHKELLRSFWDTEVPDHGGDEIPEETD